MKITRAYTSYFARIGGIPSNFTLFSIAGKPPQWYIPTDSGRFRELPMLFPKYIWWKEWHDRFHSNPESDESRNFYISRYNETVLDKVDVGLLMEILVGCRNTPCLLCYERPERFCHRHLVAEFLTRHGMETVEFPHQTLKSV